MNYEASILHAMYQKLNEQKVLSNDTKELINMSVTFDMQQATGTVQFETRESNKDYLKKELLWYLSMDLTPPKDIKIWDQIKSREGKVNSNYGYLVYSSDNCKQFQHALAALQTDKNTRQAVLLYNRPSIQEDWNRHGMHDFICTFYQHFFIRDNVLICLTNMRSNDCIFGTFNDIPWFEHIYNEMYNSLLCKYPTLQKGPLTFTANSFHCYARHFDTLDKIAHEPSSN